MSSWYEFAPLTKLLEVLNQRLNRGELNDVMDYSLRLMSSHSLRKSSTSEAVKELEETSIEIISLRKKLSGMLGSDEEENLLSLSALDIDSVDSIEEVRKIKQAATRVISLCDKKINSDNGG